MSETVRLDALLSEYVDIINAHGSGSPEAGDFRERHAADKKLIKLLDAADRVKAGFGSGELT